MKETEINTIWQEYLRDKSKNNLKEKLLLHYIPLVRLIAGRMRISMPKSVALEDLVSSGFLGLLGALDKYDDSKNVKFETFANIKIRGAILDGLREVDWMPRGIREKNNQLENAIRSAEKKCGRIPTDIEIAEELNISMDDYFELLNDVKVVSLMSLDNTLNYGDGNKNLLDVMIDSNASDPDEIVERQELKNILVQCIMQLKEKEKNVVALYYYEQLTLKEIGEVLSVSESRISQIHTKVIITLRNKIKDYLMN